jgi:hypothetical protein
MIDFSDPAIWSPAVQTVVLTMTLVIFIFSFRSQNRAMREQAYERVMDDYGDALRMLLEKPELYQFQADLFNRSNRFRGAERRSFTREDLVVRNWVVMMYGFFERLHFLYRRKWIDENTWRQWAAFLAIVADHPVFRDVHQSSAEMFDKEFVDYVSSMFADKPQKTVSNLKEPS